MSNICICWCDYSDVDYRREQVLNIIKKAMRYSLFFLKWLNCCSSSLLKTITKISAIVPKVKKEEQLLQLNLNSDNYKKSNKEKKQKLLTKIKQKRWRAIIEYGAVAKRPILKKKQ